ncbi:MAG: glycosyltransferase family 9 protein [Verrucomicrobiota bacterium]
MRNAIVSYKQLGDVLLLEPLSRLLAARAGGEPTAMLVRPAFAPLIELMPKAEMPTQAWEKYNLLLATHEGTKAWKRALFSRAHQKRLLLSQKVYQKWWHRLAFGEITYRYIDGAYWARYFWEALAKTGEPEFSPPRLQTPAADWLPKDLPERYLVCHPTAAWSSKYWTVRGWQLLLKELERTFSLPLVLTAGAAAEELAFCRTLQEALPFPVQNLAGSLSLSAYLATLSRAQAILAIDGSAAHLADAFSVPAFKLFGNTSESEWHWPNPRSQVVTTGEGPPLKRPPAKDLQADKVLQAAQEWAQLVVGS